MDDYSIQLELLEYNHRQGVITQADYTKLKSKKKLSQGQKKVQKLGQVEIFTVLRVDEIGGFIDLTKNELLPEVQKEIESRYNKGKAIQSNMISLSERLKIPLSELYAQIVFPLQRSGNHAYDVFQANVFDLDKLIEPLKLHQNLSKELKELIKLKYTPPSEEIKAVFEIHTLSKEGVLDIKNVLLAAEKMQTQEIPLQVKLEATPYYTVFTKTPNRQLAVEVITQVLTKIEELVSKLEGGKYALKSFNKTTDEDNHHFNQLVKMDVDEKRSVVEEDNDEGMGGYADPQFDEKE